MLFIFLKNHLRILKKKNVYQYKYLFYLYNKKHSIKSFAMLNVNNSTPIFCVFFGIKTCETHAIKLNILIYFPCFSYNKTNLFAL
jgi:hypothetical protein